MVRPDDRFYGPLFFALIAVIIPIKNLEFKQGGGNSGGFHLTYQFFDDLGMLCRNIGGFANVGF